MFFDEKGRLTLFSSDFSFDKVGIAAKMFQAGRSELLVLDSGAELSGGFAAG